MPGWSTSTGVPVGGERRQVSYGSIPASIAGAFLPLVLLFSPFWRAGRRQRGHSLKKKPSDEDRQKAVEPGRCRICGKLTVRGICTNPSCESRRLHP